MNSEIERLEQELADCEYKEDAWDLMQALLSEYRSASGSRSQGDQAQDGAGPHTTAQAEAALEGASGRARLILATVRDMMSNLLYYDRKEDEELPVGVIGKAIYEHEVLIMEILDVVAEELDAEVERVAKEHKHGR